MTYSRRLLLRSLIMAPGAMAWAAPLRLWAQDDPFGGEDPPNVFFSPCGRPFRAHHDAPYPVVDWFKQADANGDGKLDKAEFIADTLAFFKLLDRNDDGVISPQEIAFYEQKIAPEVLGMRVEGTSGRVLQFKPWLWKTQGIPGGMGPGGEGVFRPGGATGPGVTVDPGAGSDEGPDESGPSRPYDASGKGAAPYGFFDEPEPVAAADVNFRGLINKADFVHVAGVHFDTLDTGNKGFLTLEGLPKTPVQRRLERRSRRR